MDYPPLSAVSPKSKEDAYADLRKQIEAQKKDPGYNQYYRIKHTIAFSKDDKKITLYCFSTVGRNSSINEF